jgi:hypothetical protein
MEKQIFTIGYTIPTFDKNYVDFYDGASLSDADILLISPDSLTPRGDWVSFIRAMEVATMSRHRKHTNRKYRA